MPDASPPPLAKTLGSWKEIAAFFGRDLRTVQRWEKEEALPVHRHLHQRRSSIYAYTEELEAWWKERGPQLSQRNPHIPFWRGAGVRWGALGAGLAVPLLFAWINGRNPAHTAELRPERVFQAIAFDGTRSPGYLSAGLAGDLNGDGRDDIVLSAFYAGEIYILLGGSLPPAGGQLPAAANIVVAGRKRTYLRARQVGDFNGDGIKDLLVSEWLPEPDSYHRTGLSHLFWGRAEWPRLLRLPQDADVTLRTDFSGYTRQTDGCLRSAEATDLNRDGVEDVILGAFEHAPLGRGGAGAVLVLFGRRQWPREVEVLSGADLTIYGSRTGEALGTSCSVGDFNGDGWPDLGTYAGEDNLWNLLGGAGRVYLFHGRAKWPARLDAKTDFDFLVRGEVRETGASKPVMADLNGDGRDDLIIGWYGRGNVPDFPGEVHIWFGGDSRRGTFPAHAPDVAITGSSPGAQLGAALAASDLDGDGISDLVVSEAGRGEVHLLFGRREWQEQGRLQDYGARTLFRGEKGAGSYAMGLGDFDGDRLPEVVFSASEAPAGAGERAGRAWLLKPYLPMRVDVRPEYPRNVVLFYPGNLVAARLYGDAHSRLDPIEPGSVRLAGAAPERHLVQDYNGDGFPDWQLYFDTTHLRVTPETKRVALTARTRGGLPVAGSDVVEIITSRASSAGKKPQGPSDHGQISRPRSR